MDALPGTDLYRLDDLLTDEEKLARRSTRDFVEREFMPVVQKHFRAGTFPLEAGLAGMGLYHALIGVIEAVVTAVVIALIAGSRPDILERTAGVPT
jgi:hypothetical protein